MRIFYSTGSDPMLLDSRDALAQLHGTLHAFLQSSSLEVLLPAEQSGSPAPYQLLLAGLRVRKSNGPILLRRLADGWLDLQGSTENLGRYASYFLFDPGEQGHHHPEYCDAPGYMSPASMSLIIEADATSEGDGAV